MPTPATRNKTSNMEYMFIGEPIYGTDGKVYKERKDGFLEELPNPDIKCAVCGDHVCQYFDDWELTNNMDECLCEECYEEPNKCDKCGDESYKYSTELCEALGDGYYCQDCISKTEEGPCCVKCSAVVPEEYLNGNAKDEMWIEDDHTGWYCPNHSPTNS